MIVDTNAVSLFAQGNPAAREVIARNDEPYLPVIVIGELRYGLMSSRHRAATSSWLDQLLEQWPILDITKDTAEEYSRIRQWLKENARPIPANDMWIAALARQHSMPVLTNDKHFDDIPGVEVIGW